MVLYKHPDDGKVPKDNFTHCVTPSSEIVDYDYVTSYHAISLYPNAITPVTLYTGAVFNAVKPLPMVPGMHCLYVSIVYLLQSLYITHINNFSQLLFSCIRLFFAVPSEAMARGFTVHRQLKSVLCIQHVFVTLNCPHL
jgi:hypothetical protein